MGASVSLKVSLGIWTALSGPWQRRGGSVLAEMSTRALLQQAGHVAAEAVHVREFVHKAEDFNTAEISDCSDSLEALRNGKREARESRQMMWEDHYAAQLHTEQARYEAAKQQKLRHETAMLTQLKSDSDKWNMAIDLRLLEFIEASLSVATEETKRTYFVSTNKAGLPPLHRACKTNDMQLVKLLLRLGADLTTKDYMQKVSFRDRFFLFLHLTDLICWWLKSVFHVMAEFRLTDLFKFLAAMLTQDTEDILLGLDNNGYSLFHIAAANGSDGILTELLAESRRDRIKLLVNVITQDEKRTALHLAALRGHIACIEMLLNVAGAKADLRDRRGSNALHLALQQTFDIDKLVVAFLTHTPPDQVYATFSSLDEVSGQSCLHTSIIKNFRKVSVAFIRSGKVQINATTRDGSWTPLHLAVITEEIDVIKELLSAGATLDALDADGQTPLLQACLGGQLKIVRLLLNAGANPSHQNKQAHSPLHYLSAFCRDRQLLRDIISGGADVNAKSMKLNTPMHFAAMNGNEVATQVLLEHGASASVINEDKRSVVYLAKKWRHRSVEDLVRPPEEDAEHRDTHSSMSASKPKSPLAMASRQAQLRSMGHARAATHARPRTALALTTRSEESDSNSLYDFEDDELILPPSTPWPVAMENSSSTGSNNNQRSNSKPVTSESCRTFSELRDRFMGDRSPLKPVVLAQDRQKGLMDEILASRAKREERSTLSSTPMLRFTRQLVVEPVRIPWEMTVPVSHSSSADAISNQRKLKPSIRTNIGLLRDHLAHAPQLHWPRQAGHAVFQTNFIRRVAAPDRPNSKRRQKNRLAMAGATMALIGASAGVGYATLRSAQSDTIATPAKQQMAASLEVPDFVESMGDPYYPSFDELDQDGDGIVNYEEYMRDLNIVWKKDRENIASSDLPEIVKEDLNSQLDDKIASDSACVKKAMIPTIDSLYYMLEVYCFDTPIEVPQKYMEMFPSTQAPVVPLVPAVPDIPAPPTATEAATSAPIAVETPTGPATVTITGPEVDGKQPVTITTPDGGTTTTTVDVTPTSDGKKELEIPTGPEGTTTTVTVPATPTEGTNNEGGYPTGTNTQGGYPTGTTTEGGYPTATTTEVGNPSGTTTEAGYPTGTTTEGGNPSGTTTEGGYPMDTTTEGGYPTGTTTEGGYPTGTTTEVGNPSGTTTEGGYPMGTTTEGGYPTGTTTEGGYPSGTTTEGGYPTGTTTGGGYPTGTTTDGGYPMGTTTEGGNPGTTTEGGYPNGNPSEGGYPNGNPEYEGDGGYRVVTQTIAIDTPEGPGTVTITGPEVDGKQPVTITTPDGGTTTTTVDVTPTSDGKKELEIPTGPEGTTTTVTVPSTPTEGNNNEGGYPNGNPEYEGDSGYRVVTQTIAIDTPEGPGTVTITGPEVDGKQPVTITTPDGGTTTTTVDVTPTSDGKKELEIPTGPEGTTTTVTVPSTPTEGNNNEGGYPNGNPELMASSR
ncbi:unnamed protein product [Phytophthora lilii]|uniref:Unnamed protein product n=1 Tax=Phytophthora lilii TaxID=2077276 RepID=A0A9W6X5Z6_9STRA|nr:unnamed protein product [Phytophthora lilii]